MSDKMLSANSETGPGPSPGPSEVCSVCLDSVTERALLEPCRHPYCLCCLLDWCQKFTDCCKCWKGFNLIITNIRSESDYDLIEVQSKVTANKQHSLPNEPPMGAMVEVKIAFLFSGSSETKLIPASSVDLSEFALSCNGRDLTHMIQLVAKTGSPVTLRSVNGGSRIDINLVVP